MVLRLAKLAARLIATVIAAGLLGGMLVRFAPAYGVSEAELDPRFSREVRALGAAQPSIWEFYGEYARGLLKGDLGVSQSLQRPIAVLLRERLPVSLRSLGWGSAAGIGAGLGLAMLVITFRWPGIGALPAMASTVLLSIPSAALALLFLVVGWPPWLALAALMFPRVYRYGLAVLRKSAAAPHVTAARARGVSGWRILTAHIVPVAGPQLWAVAGMAISIGFPALVPIEAVSDSPGIMQLALNAALARDLPLLVVLTTVAAAVILLGNAGADLSAASEGHIE